MRLRQIVSLAIFVVIPSISMAGTSTPNYGLYKPTQGEVGWASAVNENFDKIDAALNPSSSINWDEVTFPPAEVDWSEGTTQNMTSINWASFGGLSAEADPVWEAEKSSYLTAEVDGSTTNEIQDLSLSSNTLSLSGDATTVNLAPYLDNTDDQTCAEVSGCVTNALSAVDDTIYAKSASPLFTGNVGIGTTAPLSSIEIVSDTGLNVMSSNKKSVLLVAAANVGIGSTAPTQKLDVAGLIKATNVPTVVSMSGDVAVGTTVKANVTGLAVAVAANTKYVIQCIVQFQSAATATGSLWTATIPSSPTLFIQTTDVTSGTATVGRTTTASSDGGTVVASSGYNTAANMAYVNALLLNGANAGTWQLRFASELGGSNITAKSGSACWYWSY